MRNVFASGWAVVSAYTVSIVSFVNHVNTMVTILSALAGVVLTFSTAYLQYHKARKLKAETESIEIENDKLEHDD